MAAQRVGNALARADRIMALGQLGQTKVASTVRCAVLASMGRSWVGRQLNDLAQNGVGRGTKATSAAFSKRARSAESLTLSASILRTSMSGARGQVLLNA